MAKWEQHNDLPRAEIMKKAEDTIRQYKDKGIDAEVKFNFTCGHCGERCTLEESNMLYEYGECFGCGKETKIDKAGFSLIANLR